jgi:translation initiation factor 2A
VLWSDDESLAARMVSSEVQFFAGDELKSIVGRIKLDNVTQFSFAPNGSAKAQVVATFSPEKKGSAALCRLFRYPECESPLNTKAFFNATDVTFQWNAKGNSLLLTSHTDVDSSGQSYYGVDRLYILSTDSSLAESVELKAEGSIHAVAWHSDGKSFAVCYGKMPAHTTFYSSRGKPIADLGQGSNNTLAYAPSGKVLLIGGFGNLQGEMGFWEPTKLKLFGRATAYCSSVQSWSPSSRHLLTAVLSPRIRVDNGFKLFTYAGKLVTDVAIPDLYDAMWRPALPGVYPVPQRPLSAQLIDPSDVAKLGAAAAAAAASSPAAAASAAVKVAAYVPPALRNRQGGGAPATSSVTAQLRAGQTTGVKFHAPKVVVPVGETPVDPYEAALSGEKKPKKKAAPKAAAPKKVEPAFVIEDPEF